MNALIKITEKIKETIDKGKYGCGIFIDLCKAIDTVNHDILLLKMEHYWSKRLNSSMVQVLSTRKKICLY